VVLKYTASIASISLFKPLIRLEMTADDGVV